MSVRLLQLATAALLFCGCVTHHVLLRKGTQSFAITVDNTSAGYGTADQPLPYATADHPVTFTLHAKAMAWNGIPDTSFNGTVLLDAHPGTVSPLEFNVTNGSGDVTVTLYNAFGETHVWIEDCGVKGQALRSNCTDEDRANWVDGCIPLFQAGTLSTGITPAFFFGNPSISQVQATTDNTTSPLIPLEGDRCASLSDPRFVDVSALSKTQRTNLAAGVFAPKAGQLVNMAPRCVTYADDSHCGTGQMSCCEANGLPCSVNADCGQMIVQSITNEGFYVTDVVEPPASTGIESGFRSLYIFNFAYPDGLQIGDALLTLQGSPSEFSGDTQLGNPQWTRDPAGPYPNALPAPVFIPPATYLGNVSASGGNVGTALDLERLESAIVCMDGLVPPGELRSCDVNMDGKVSRSGHLCLLKQAGGAFIACRDAVATNPAIDCSVDCGVSSCPQGQSLFVADNAEERCCEAECYADPNCTEASSYNQYQQWAAQISASSTPLKIGVNSTTVPGFDPVGFVASYASKQQSAPTIAVTGNLIQVLASRPVWLIQPRGADDFIIGGTCPQ